MLAVLLFNSLFSVSAVLSSPGAVGAQEGACGGALAKAERAYSLGQFVEAIDAIDRCRDSLPRPDQPRAYELLARSYIREALFAKAEEAVGELMRRNSDFRPSRQDPPVPLFADMVERARQYFVRSVSKFAEDWREAPGTIAVVTAEEIERRGYRDVEAVLHDLPGFDFSRGNGDLYSTIYQRGYRSSGTDRMLVLVDGIEQNDLHSNIAYVSRQYPLSLIERIEVVYGPASTIYGPNALTGVIDIITREPDQMVAGPGNHAAKVMAAAGAFRTHVEEATYAGRTSDNQVSWSMTGRFYRSDEPNLSSDPSWGYGFPKAFDEVDYRTIMELEGKTLDNYLCARLTPEGLHGHVLDHPERCAIPTAAAPAVGQCVRHAIVISRSAAS